MSDQGLVIHILTLLALAVTATAALCLLLLPLARRIGWLDVPDARKTHQKATPLVGGVAIFFVFFTVCAALNAPVLPLFVASLIVLLTGLVDDRLPLPAWVRFLLQTLACLVMVFWAELRLDDFGALFWPSVLELGPLAIPVSVFAALGVINAFNMIDGLDGLSGSIFVVAVLAMVLAAFGTTQGDVLLLLMLMAACVVGFLLLNARFPWNPQARTFLGDSGSVLLGFWLGWGFIALGNDQGDALRGFAPMTAVWIFGVPLLDTTRLMRNRWKAGKSAFEADRSHLHHAFLAAGFTVGQAWWRIVALSMGFAAVGIIFEWFSVPEYLSFYSFVLVGLIYLRFVNAAWDKGQFLGKNLNQGGGESPGESEVPQKVSS